MGYGPDQRDRAFYMEMRNNTVAVCGAQSASNESYGTKTVDVSQWHHYALVYSSGTVSFYLDGESCGTFTYQYNTDNSQALIGIISDRSNGGGEKQIARAKIYNRALSSTEIAELADEFQI
jgi:beta-glucanase (GH16 family)